MRYSERELEFTFAKNLYKKFCFFWFLRFLNDLVFPRPCSFSTDQRFSLFQRLYEKHLNCVSLPELTTDERKSVFLGNFNAGLLIDTNANYDDDCDDFMAQQV